MCSICTDTSMPLNICDRDKPESFERFTCDHIACRSCLTRYIQSHIKDKTVSIPCPHKECTGIVSYYDINRIDTELAGDYRALLQEMFAVRPDIDELVDKPSQCPTCRVYAYVYDGCDVIYCICGVAYCSVCEKYYVNCIC